MKPVARVELVNCEQKMAPIRRFGPRNDAFSRLFIVTARRAAFLSDAESLDLGTQPLMGEVLLPQTRRE